MSVQRIFHIQPGTDGGTERFMITLAQGFAARGITQGFAIRPGRDWADEIASLGVIEEGPFLRRTPGGLLSLWRLQRMIRAWRPDAIMAWRAPAARLVPRIAGVAKIVRLGDHPRHARHFAGLDAVVCNNPSIARHVAGLGWAGETPVISNFARPSAAKPIARAALDTPDDAFVVCSTGRFIHAKGFHVLIDAVAQLPQAWLWLVGDGEETARLKAQVAALGMEGRVRFAGWRPDPTAVIAAADAFVMPSFKEALGNVLIEAWSVGIPSVATKTRGPDWYATDGQDCLIVPIEDADAIAQALGRLMADPALRARLVAGAHATLAQRFGREAVLDAYLATFDRLKQAQS
jgi:glycosyltransferase involved in cell wall biosynthesis